MYSARSSNSGGPFGSSCATRVRTGSGTGIDGGGVSRESRAPETAAEALISGIEEITGDLRPPSQQILSSGTASGQMLKAIWTVCERQGHRPAPGGLLDGLITTASPQKPCSVS